MSVVDQAVEDGIGDGRLVDEVMPFVDRDLAGVLPGTVFISLLKSYSLLMCPHA